MARHVPVYGVFIIESLDWDNEARNKLDGAVLKAILELSDIPTEYIYIRNRQELQDAMELFKTSDYGFLHISCHGNEEGICLTTDEVSFDDLGVIMGPYLKYRRLFLSACRSTCFSMAEHFIPHFHCYSVMGPSEEIAFDKAAIFWSSYYYLMYRDDKKVMFQINIIPTLQNITQTFSESLNYFSIINEGHPQSKFSLREIHFKNGRLLFDEVRATRFENLYWDEATL